MGIESEGLKIYVASGLGGGFSPTYVLIAANDWNEAYLLAKDHIPHFVMLAAAQLASWGENKDYEGEWEEPLDAPSGPRVLAEYYA